MEDIKAVLKDVERFLTQVLGKVGNLPEDVNKERLKLSERLQKFLNLPQNEVKRKPPPPEPVEPMASDEEEGEYGDVAVSKPVVTNNDHQDVQETYDDVASAMKSGEADAEELYDDVARGNVNDSSKKNDGANTDGSESGELYDDVNSNARNDGSLSRTSVSSENLDAKNVGEPKKVSEIHDKVYEGYLDKYKTKGFMNKLQRSKWQRRYCVLTPLALYYYADPKDAKQKGTIILPSGDCFLRKGAGFFPEVKDGKLCFELGSSDRCFLFKVTKESERDIWVRHVMAALQTDLTEEQAKLVRQKSLNMAKHDDDDGPIPEFDEELYEPVDTYQKAPSSSSNGSEPAAEEMYELTEQFSQVKESSGSSTEAPALPSRNKPTEEATAPELPSRNKPSGAIKDDDLMDYELPGVQAPRPKLASEEKVKEKEKDETPPAVVGRSSRSSDALASAPRSAQEVPQLPPRGEKSTPKQPPLLPVRTTPPMEKKTPELPVRTTPPLTKKHVAAEPAPSLQEQKRKAEPERKPEVISSSAPAAEPKGEQFDYARVYVAMWNCDAGDEDDLSFSRGNYLYIREKIPNSDWWVASLMDIPDIRVGLVPRNYIMPAYEL